MINSGGDRLQAWGEPHQPEPCGPVILLRAIMITDAYLDAPTERTVERAARPSKKSMPAPGEHFSRPTRGVEHLDAGVIGLDIGRYGRRAGPVPDLETVGHWTTRHQHAQAESALGERRGQAPHDGQARTLLAQVFAARDCALRRSSPATPDSSRAEASVFLIPLTSFKLRFGHSRGESYSS